MQNRVVGPIIGLLLLVMHAAAAQTPAPGQLLVAAPQIGDPRFARTVILILQHDDSGAVGIIINRPVDRHPLSFLLAAIGVRDRTVKGDVLVFAGGPVQPEVGFVVHSTEYRRDATVPLGGHLALTATADILRDIGHAKGPKHSLVAFGYAGWAPGQLEMEMARHDWAVAAEDAGLVFAPDRDCLWDLAWQRRLMAL